LGSDNDAFEMVVNPHYVIMIQLTPHREQCASHKTVCKFCRGKNDNAGDHTGFINTLCGEKADLSALA
jgi:tRNA(Ile2) C34 agmatinyltransferase TiaS